MKEFDTRVSELVLREPKEFALCYLVIIKLLAAI